MIDEIIIGLIGGAAGEKLAGRWTRRHPYLTAAICMPPLLLLAFLIGKQMLGL